jgi:hypothetical protein
MSEPKFSRDLRVAFRDRGMGRGDYGIISLDGPLIAELHGTFQSEFPGAQVEILPVIENAHLFAAAPDLYDACAKALPVLEKAGDKEAVAIVQAALKKALPPEPDPSRKRRR